MNVYEQFFQQVVEGTKQFQVPLYQRPFSWGKKELDQLWEDLTEQMEAATAAHESGTASATHFLGSTVLAPTPSASGDMTRWLLVDGQQRLTTLSIALAAIRDRLKVLAPPEPGEAGEHDRIHNTYLVNQYKKKLDRFRIVPTQADRLSYQAIIDGTSGAGSDDAIGYAYNYLSKCMSGFDTDELLALEAAIGRRLSLVEIQTDPGDNVFRIFESLNNTGKGLGQIDLLRNYVFMLLPETADEVYESVWLPMQEELGTEYLESLAWLDLILRGREDAKQREVYRTQQQRLEAVARSGGEEAVRRELVQLRYLGRLLLRIVEPERDTASEPNPEIRLALSRLAAWGNTIYRPLALRLLMLREEGHASDAEVVRALGYMEGYLVRRAIVRIHSQGLNQAFLRAPAKLVPGDPVDAAVHRYLSNPRLRWPTDEELTEALMTGSFYWTGRMHQRNYVLRRLEESYGAPEPIDFNKAKLTIEHVMPQRLTPQWHDVLEQQCDSGETVPELQERLLHTIGNLTLTAQNSKLSNSMFDRKRRIFESSALRMNREIAEANSWGRPEIEARGRRLAQRASELWPAPKSDPSVSAETLLRNEPISQATTMIPAGKWTTCQAIAQVIGTAPIGVASFLRAHPGVPNAHRVFNAKGDPIAGADATAVLAEEGVAFHPDGRPVPSHKIDGAELAELMGLEVDAGTNLKNRFRALLKGNQPAPVVHAAQALLEDWQSLGGALTWSDKQKISCYLAVWGSADQADEHWLLVLHPVSGSVSVALNDLARRAPFKDTGLRRDLLKRLNMVNGIDLPDSALERRVSFPMSALTDGGGKQVFAALEWFHERCGEWLAQQG